MDQNSFLYFLHLIVDQKKIPHRLDLNDTIQPIDESLLSLEGFSVQILDIF